MKSSKFLISTLIAAAAMTAPAYAAPSDWTWSETWESSSVNTGTFFSSGKTHTLAEFGGQDGCDFALKADFTNLDYTDGTSAGSYFLGIKTGGETPAYYAIRITEDSARNVYFYANNADLSNAVTISASSLTGGNISTTLEYSNNKLSAYFGETFLGSISLTLDASTRFSIGVGYPPEAWSGNALSNSCTFDAATLSCDVVNPSPYTWNGGKSGVWNISSTSWTKDGTNSVSYVNESNVIFDTENASVEIEEGISAVDVKISADTTFTGAGDLTIQSLSGNKNLVKSGTGTMTINGVGTYSGTLEISGGTVELGVTGNDINGALGEQDKDGPGTRTAAVVKTDGTLDLNGKYDNGYKIELAGGTLTNTGGSMGTTNRQLVGIKVSEDGSKVTVEKDKNFGLLAGGYKATSIDLGGKTLKKDGVGSLHLTATTITAGTFDITEGDVSVRNGVVDFKMESGALIKLSNGVTLTAFDDAANLENEARNHVVTLGDVGIVLNETATLALKIAASSSAKFAVGDGATLYLDISKLGAMPVSDGETKAFQIAMANAFNNTFYTKVEVGSWGEDGKWADSDEWAFSGFDNTRGEVTLTATVPEPSAFGLLAGIGALALVASRRRRK